MFTLVSANLQLGLEILLLRSENNFRISTDSRKRGGVSDLWGTKSITIRGRSTVLEMSRNPIFQNPDTDFKENFDYQGLPDFWTSSSRSFSAHLRSTSRSRKTTQCHKVWWSVKNLTLVSKRLTGAKSWEMAVWPRFHDSRKSLNPRLLFPEYPILGQILT